MAVFSSIYSLYGYMSLRRMEVLQEFTTPEVEVYLTDEAFMGLEARPRQSFRDYAHSSIRYLLTNA